MIHIGQKVDDQTFEIYHNDEFKNTKFSDYLGKWLVVLFYPADFTFICPTELEETAHHYESIKSLGAEIISMSTDTAFVHKAWHDTSDAIKKINFPMGSDPSGKICKQFGTYIEDEGLSLRGTFIIDPDGVLKSFEINDNSIGRSAVELHRKLQAAKFVYDNGGVEVCPANWHPGDKTLKPGIDLVGKI